jgi:N-acetyl-alpha-D-glucosaminyl L-malate synthase BshA
MKIGITCYPTYGGSGVVATELGKALAKRGHIIHFISHDLPFRLREFSENIFYHEVSINDYPLFLFPPYSISLASKIADVMCYEELDVMHVHYAIPHAISAFLAREIQRDRASLVRQCKEAKIITTLHGTDITLVGTDPSLSGAVRLGINRSDGVTAVSKYLRDVTVQDFKPDVEIRAIPNFVDTTEFSRKGDCDRFRAAFAPKDDKILIHISNFRPLKRVGDVIRIFHAALEHVPCRLLFVGDGPDRPEAEKLTRELGLSDKVRFLGKQEAVVELLSISDVMIMPSENESFGLAALEAMSCSVPVIASRIGGLQELVCDGKNGYTFELGKTDDAVTHLCTLLRNDALYKRLALGARQTAEQYDIAKIIPLYEQYYEEILAAS